MDRAQSIMAHLSELRRRIIYSLIAIVVGVGAGWVLVPGIYHSIMSRAPVPLTQIGVTEIFLVQFHLGMYLGILAASPFILYQLIAFLLPALTGKERTILFTLLPAAVGLFVAGFGFSYWFVVPAATRFFIGVAVDSGSNVIVSPTQWADMILHFSVPLGAVFELPVVVWLLALIGLVTAVKLRRWRKFAVLGSLVVGALISPAPIVVDQCVMAVPMLLLYEVSIIITAIVERRKARELSA